MSKLCCWPWGRSSWHVRNGRANSIRATSSLFGKLYFLPIVLSKLLDVELVLNYAMDFASLQTNLFAFKEWNSHPTKTSGSTCSWGQKLNVTGTAYIFPGSALSLICPVPLWVAFDFFSKHLPTLTVPLWGFSTNKVDLSESSRFSVSSPSPIDHTEMQREREIWIVWVLYSLQNTLTWTY